MTEFSNDGLTAREMDICVLLCQAQSAAEIANSLSLSKKTVRNVAQSAYDKLGITGPNRSTKLLLFVWNRAVLPYHAPSEVTTMIKQCFHRRDGSMLRIDDVVKYENADWIIAEFETDSNGYVGAVIIPKDCSEEVIENLEVPEVFVRDFANLEKVVARCSSSQS